MIDRQHALPLAKQAKALGISQLRRQPAARPVTIRRVPRLFDLHAVLGAMFCCFFQFQGSNS